MNGALNAAAAGLVALALLRYILHLWDEHRGLAYLLIPWCLAFLIRVVAFPWRQIYGPADWLRWFQHYQWVLVIPGGIALWVGLNTMLAARRQRVEQLLRVEKQLNGG